MSIDSKERDPKEQEKQAAARRGVSYVENGMVVGLGTGSTAKWAIQYLGERVRDGLAIRGVPTSLQSEKLAAQSGIPLVHLSDAPEVDVTIDGADEVDPDLQLIKGAGGALVREKVVASASRLLIILADSSKQVQTLGAHPLPIAVLPFAAPLVARRIQEQGAPADLRMRDGKAFVTDDGLHILDCRFGQIADPRGLARALEALPGVAGHGLFLDMADIVLVAGTNQVMEIRRK